MTDIDLPDLINIYEKYHFLLHCLSVITIKLKHINRLIRIAPFVPGGKRNSKINICDNKNQAR
jgi:hypothetical protein